MNHIYFDNNASTPIDPRVFETMLPYFNTNVGNPSSNHFLGAKSKKAVEQSREIISNILNSKLSDLIFTSGATEAINLALKGIAESHSYKGKHIITTQTEHSAVLEVCKYLERKGFEVEFISVDKYGLIDINELTNKMRKDTILVSIIYVNNETGVIQPIKEIGKICRNKNVFFFTDATQAIGKIQIDVEDLNIDLMCFSGHKFYGPKGVGGLYCKSNIKLEPLIHGGGHERGLRSGTLNVPGIVGLAKALETANTEMKQIQENVKTLRDTFENELLETRMIKVNGHPTQRLFNVSNICLTGIDSYLVQNKLRDVAYSQGSACYSSAIKPSHVLKAMGLSDNDALSSFRFSFGKQNNMDEINLVIRSFKKLFESKTKLN
ncbi:MAG TPA: cysteine desulfurase family protein [Ignavibacteriaceae bacterium]|nr:cysteine desulfurase family protein [Ignavibacteriaceae bacterium]